MSGEKETYEDIERRIARRWGFKRKRVALLEAYCVGGVCLQAQFIVAGIDYRTDFRTLEILDPPDAA